MSIHCSHCCHQDKLEHNVRFTHTHSLPITTGSGQTTTHYSSSYLCISKLPDYQIWHAQISPRVTQTHITHSTRINYPGQSNTSPKPRWTGNSPTWGKITVPTGVSFIYDHPTHTPHRFGYANLTTTPTLRTATNARLFKRMIDRMFDHYILLSSVSKHPFQNIPELMHLITHVIERQRHFSNTLIIHMHTGNTEPSKMERSKMYPKYQTELYITTTVNK